MDGNQEGRQRMSGVTHSPPALRPVYALQDAVELAGMLPELTLLEGQIRTLRNDPTPQRARDALNYVDGMRPLLLRLAVALEQEAQHDAI